VSGNPLVNRDLGTDTVGGGRDPEELGFAFSRWEHLPSLVTEIAAFASVRRLGDSWLNLQTLVYRHKQQPLPGLATSVLGCVHYLRGPVVAQIV
jgi:hypothetical protein